MIYLVDEIRFLAHFFTAKTILLKIHQVKLRGFWRDPKLVELQVPPTIDVLFHFKKEFSKIFEMRKFRYGKFFRKILIQNFRKFFKIEITITLVLKYVRNHHVDQNLTKFSFKCLTSANFSLKAFIFAKYGVLDPFRTRFFVELGSSLWAEVPQKTCSKVALQLLQI